MILDGQYHRYNEQNAYILSIANFDPGCGGGELWQRMQALEFHKLRFEHIGFTGTSVH